MKPRRELPPAHAWDGVEWVAEREGRMPTARGHEFKDERGSDLLCACGVSWAQHQAAPAACALAVRIEDEGASA